jgi:hypothetical protein
MWDLDDTGAAAKLRCATAFIPVSAAQGADRDKFTLVQLI